MKYIVRITDNGPLSFRAGRGTTSGISLDYVPGSTLLGGLAAAHQTLRHDAGEFERFFFSADSLFNNLYPSSFDNEDLQGETDPVFPLPTTALTCKRFKGFRSDEEDAAGDPHHGVYDSLITWALFALSGEMRLDVFDGLRKCPHEGCQAPLDAFTGFIRRETLAGEVWGKAKVARGLRTRTGINRATGTVQREILYSRELIGPGTTFWGTLSVLDDPQGSFASFVEEANTSDLLRLGNNRTRGFGRVRLQLRESVATTEEQTLQEQIENFNRALRQKAEVQGIATPHQFYLPLTLTSDAILYDNLLRYRTALTSDYLAEVWNIPGAELLYQNSRTKRVMGWNDLWRLPKQDDVAITMGSVFLFGLSTPLPDVISTLLQMQQAGIGHRRREGFGQLQVAMPFHWEVQGQ